MIKKSFYRAEALAHYQQEQVPKVMPKFISPFLIFFFWILFLLLLAGAVTIWSYNPVHIEQGSGMLVSVAAKSLPDYGLPKDKSSAQTIAIVLLPGSLKMLLHTGNAVAVQPEGTHQYFNGTIASIDTTTQTANAARVHYHLSQQILSHSPSSIVVAIIRFGTSKISASYNQKFIIASIDIKIPSVLYLFFTNQKLPGTA